MFEPALVKEYGPPWAKLVLTHTYIWLDEKYRRTFPVSELKRKWQERGAHFPGMRVIRTERYKQIGYVQRCCGEENLGFYVKSQRPKRPLRQIIRSGFRPVSRARREMELLRMYRQRGFATSEVVAVVEERFLWIPIRAFSIEKEVVGTEFVELLRNARGRTLERYLLSYGKLVGQLHSAGIITSNVRVTDLICTSEIDAPWRELELTIIDRERGSLSTEAFEFELVCERLSALLVRYNIYVGEPSQRGMVAFLAGYMSYLAVPEQPDRKALCGVVRRLYARRVKRMAESRSKLHE